ncbi:MAG: class I SAM-dependent methyltransferase [Bdellovibrionales bacterium]|nr:class I SAM-dependent methyltransferase [Bdellovibrionales bacterium]
MDTAKKNKIDELNNKIAQAYDSPSWWYDIRGFFILKFSYRDSLWRQIHFFSQFKGPNHLEVAIGSGTLYNLILLWRKLLFNSKVTTFGFDYAESMLAGAIKRFSKNKNIQLQKADVTNMPYATESMDSINITNAAHCFPDLELSLRECLRVLKPHGLIKLNILLHPSGLSVFRKIANRINSWGMKKGILFKPYSLEEIEEIVKKLTVKNYNLRVHGNACYVELEK